MNEITFVQIERTKTEKNIYAHKCVNKTTGSHSGKILPPDFFTLYLHFEIQYAEPTSSHSVPFSFRFKIYIKYFYSFSVCVRGKGREKETQAECPFLRFRVGVVLRMLLLCPQRCEQQFFNFTIYSVVIIWLFCCCQCSVCVCVCIHFSVNANEKTSPSDTYTAAHTTAVVSVRIWACASVCLCLSTVANMEFCTDFNETNRKLFFVNFSHFVQCLFWSCAVCSAPLYLVVNSVKYSIIIHFITHCWSTA